MAIGPITTDRSGGNDSWLGSRHGVAEAHPGTLLASAFAAAEGVVNGVVPSGYPLVSAAGGTYGPYVEGTSTGEDLVGFSIGGRDITDGDETTAVLWHGRIRLANLPITMTKPAAATPGFTLVEGN